MTTRLKVLARTQLVEGLWHVLKHHVMPMGAPANVALIEEYALAYLYQFHCNQDPLADLGRAVAGYVERWGGNPLGEDPAYKKVVLEEGEAGTEGQEHAERGGCGGFGGRSGRGSGSTGPAEPL